jgi:hypothetical protein
VQQFGVATNSLGLPGGILGLGPSQSGFAVNESYTRVLDSLARDGTISSRAYGLHLGSVEDATGKFQWGVMPGFFGVDTSRLIGPWRPR